MTTIILINSNRLSVKEIGDEVTFIALGFLVNPSFIILRYDWLFVMLLGFALTTQSKTIFNVKVRPRSIRIYFVVNNIDSGLMLHNVTKR